MLMETLELLNVGVIKRIRTLILTLVKYFMSSRITKMTKKRVRYFQSYPNLLREAAD